MRLLNLYGSDVKGSTSACGVNRPCTLLTFQSSASGSCLIAVSMLSTQRKKKATISTSKENIQEAVDSLREDIMTLSRSFLSAINGAHAFVRIECVLGELPVMVLVVVGCMIASNTLTTTLTAHPTSPSSGSFVGLASKNAGDGIGDPGARGEVGVVGVPGVIGVPGAMGVPGLVIAVFSYNNLPKWLLITSNIEENRAPNSSSVCVTLLVRG